MPIIPTLLILWPLVLIGVTLFAAALLHRLPEQCDDIWRRPHAAPARLGPFR